MGRNLSPSFYYKNPNDLIFSHFPGFPFDLAQSGEPVEPRVSPTTLGLARNDSFIELRHSSNRGRKPPFVKGGYGGRKLLQKPYREGQEKLSCVIYRQADETIKKFLF